MIRTCRHALDERRSLVEVITVSLLDKKKQKTIQAQLHLSHDYTLEICLPQQKKIKYCGMDYFDSLCQIRNILESDGSYIKCYGAAQNVYPSGMCRNMGGGRMAYKMTLGQHVDLEDLVDIFAACPTPPASLSEQYQFYQEWGKSIEYIDH